jgi:hypothetical protein
MILPEQILALRLKPMFVVAVAGLIWLTADADKAASEDAAPPSKTLQVGDQIELSQYALACRDLGVLEKGFVLSSKKICTPPMNIFPARR